MCILIRLSSTLCVLFALILCTCLTAEGKESRRKTKPYVSKVQTEKRLKNLILVKTPNPTDCPATHLTGFTLDSSQTIWVTDELKGLLFRRPGEFKWQIWNLSTKDPLKRPPVSDNTFYKVVSDSEGCVWVGTLHDGVIVFNGRTWKKYSIEEGFPGERIFALERQPQTGDIWIATSGGLVRYSPRTRQWRIWRRTNGLISEQIFAITFDRKNNLFLGTDCKGIQIASPKDDYASFKTVQFNLSKGLWQLPLSYKGDGLPSNQINALFCASNGTVFAGTSAGLAYSSNHGKSWSFIRGKNWAERVKGFYTAKKPKPKPAFMPGEDESFLLQEDYVTALTEDSQKHLWIGTRSAGCSVHDLETLRRRGIIDCDYPVLFGVEPETVFIATYGQGLRFVELEKSHRRLEEAPPMTVCNFPSDIPFPELKDMEILQNSIRKRFEKIKKNGSNWAVYLGQDWTTQGNWVSHYGRRKFIGCGMNGIMGDYEALGEDVNLGPFLYYPQQGAGGVYDRLRHWVNDPVTNNPKTLYSLNEGIRIQAECDDHGEAYSRNLSGPGILCYIFNGQKTPIRLSFYFYNKDGLSGPNRLRDYRIKVRQSPLRIDRFVSVFGQKISFFNSFQEAWDFTGRKYTNNFDPVYFSPVLAETRVKDFWGGVWTSFMIGEGAYSVEIERNGSFNTTLMGVAFDDPDAEHPANTSHMKSYEPEYYMSVPPFPLFPEWSLWKCGYEALSYQETIPLRHELKQMAYRFAISQKRSERELDYFVWHLNRWPPIHKIWFEGTMDSFWEFAKWYNTLKLVRTFYPYSRGSFCNTEEEAKAYHSRYYKDNPIPAIRGRPPFQNSLAIPE